MLNRKQMDFYLIFIFHIKDEVPDAIIARRRTRICKNTKREKSTNLIDVFSTEPYNVNCEKLTVLSLSSIFTIGFYSAEDLFLCQYRMEFFIS